jgi:hypothetical protein
MTSPASTVRTRETLIVTRSPNSVRRAAKSRRDFATAKNVARELALELQQG